MILIFGEVSQTNSDLLLVGVSLTDYQRVIEALKVSEGVALIVTVAPEVIGYLSNVKHQLVTGPIEAEL